MTLEPILKIENLQVEYRSREVGQQTRHAVRGLNLSVFPGEVFGFLGPNGAGKTTTMNVLLGFVPPTSGNAFLFGVNVREPIARQGDVGDAAVLELTAVSDADIASDRHRHRVFEERQHGAAQRVGLEYGVGIDDEHEAACRGVDASVGCVRFASAVRFVDDHEVGLAD